MSVAPHIPQARMLSSAPRSHGSALARPLPRPRPRPASESIRPRRLRDIHDRTVFEAVLHHERNRADRDDNDFSLVLVKVRPNDSRTPRRLARSIIQRLRAIDEVGWYGEGCLCVLLPNTDYEGGQIFESNVRRLAEDARISIVSRVYTYPSQWQIDSNVASSHPGPRLANASVQRATEPNQVMPHQGMTPRDLIPFVLSGLVDGLETEALGLDAVESLLARPLPLWKRMIDVLIAGSALLALAPLMGVIAVMIKRSSDGPVMFGQWRAGLGGRPFWIYKFRTMIPDAEGLKANLRSKSEQDGPAFKMKHDPRITPIGRLLRTTSLDELPQLWNVLKGDMSLVGPRPLPLDESAACKQWQKRRLDLTPGLTCIWQVKGRSRVTFTEWMRMDLAYARTRSILADLKIILSTIPAVLLRRGAR